MPKISILIFLLEIYTGFILLNNITDTSYMSDIINLNDNLNISTIIKNLLLISSLLSLIIGSVVGLVQTRIKRLLAYSTIVRRCASLIHGATSSIHCSNVYPASELGNGESPEPNLASPPEGSIKLIQNS